MLVAQIESLDREGRGVAHVEGKAVFVDGALPGETVVYSPYRKKPNWELAQLLEVRKASPDRVAPQCPWYSRCGGCSLQHFDLRAQVAAKQRILEDALWHIGRVRPGRMLSPICGPSWAYRHRARLSVRLVPKKGGILVGFHERKSSYVAQMSSCEVLPPAVSGAIVQLKELAEQLSIRERMPQVELGVGAAVTVMVLRVLEPPSPQDEVLLKQFAERTGFQLWLQPKGPDTARPFWPLDAPALDYVLPEFDVRIAFKPTDFTQVNHAVNRILVRRAMDLLQPRPGESIADFFCGLGNFTLPIARSGATVFAAEGSEPLVERARLNAAANGLACRFEAANLFEPEACAGMLAAAGKLDKVLIDPPREGATELVKALEQTSLPERIVYVSCDPATLARDAGILMQNQRYTLEAAGVVNMFPHTSHVESMALFERVS
jgi:23S rRNA (uracil1939-C5)-methyltransferase